MLFFFGLHCDCLRVFALFLFLFFFNDTATTEIYTLSLHDALPISSFTAPRSLPTTKPATFPFSIRSEEHTSELQSRLHLVCRLLLEKKKTTNNPIFLSKKNKTTRPQLDHTQTN